MKLSILPIFVVQESTVKDKIMGIYISGFETW